MKFVRNIVLFLFAVACSISYTDENKYVFVGQNESEGCAKTAFILELIGEDLSDHIQISENGEMYLKVDKILAIPKEALAPTTYFASAAHSFDVNSDAKWPWTVFVCNRCGFANPPYNVSCEKCGNLRDN